MARGYASALFDNNEERVRESVEQGLVPLMKGDIDAAIAAFDHAISICSVAHEALGNAAQAQDDVQKYRALSGE